MADTKKKKKKQKKDNLFIRGGKKVKELAGDVKAGAGTILNVYKRSLTTNPKKNILQAEREIDQHKANKLKKKGKTYNRAQNAALIRKARGETIAEVKERQKTKIKSHVSKKHEDWKKMQKGDMSKEAFIKKYPNSQTAKAAKKSRR